MIGTCESCRSRLATKVCHFEADDRFEAATFIVCDDCAPVDVEVTEFGLAALR